MSAATEPKMVLEPPKPSMNTVVEPLNTAGGTVATPTTAAVTPKSINSMNLDITLNNATRMLEASRSLNAAMHEMASCAVSTEKKEETDIEEQNELHHLLPAAEKSTNPLLKAHIKQMKKAIEQGSFTDPEMITCLLIFLDVPGKSSKLLHAFEELSNVHGPNNAKSSSDDNLFLKKDGVQKLFQCFLYSIKTCIDFEENISQQRSLGSVSPDQKENEDDVDGVWSMSDQTISVIEDIAKHATEQIFSSDFEKEKNSESAKQGEYISFQQFGDWYNSGGFALAPWLELLDLNKWHYAGREAERASAAKKASESAKKAASKGLRSDDIADDNGAFEPILEQFENPFDSPQQVDTTNSTKMHPQPAPISSGPGVNTQQQEGNALHPPQTSYPYHMGQMPQNQIQYHQKPLVLPRGVAVSFEFFGKKEYCINLSDDNLHSLQNLVRKTCLCKVSPVELRSILSKHSADGDGRYKGSRVIRRKDLGLIINDLLPKGDNSITSGEKDNFSLFITIFYLSFAKNVNEATNPSDLEQVNLNELAVGFSYLCAGKKSQKLSETFNFFSENDNGNLTCHKLERFFRSYLRMVVGISLISSNPNLSRHHVNALLGMNPTSAYTAGICYTAETGSSWFVSDLLKKSKLQGSQRISFEQFANWYTKWGYVIAPWFEFLDHSKITGLLEAQSRKFEKPPIIPNMPYIKPPMPLPQNTQVGPKSQAATATRMKVAETSPSMRPLNPPNSSGKIRTFDEIMGGETPFAKKARSNQSQSTKTTKPVKEKLCSFPLKGDLELIVLREDAAYVREVAEQFGLLSVKPSIVWGRILALAKKKPLPLHPSQGSNPELFGGKCREMDQANFVEGVTKSIPKRLQTKKSQPPLAPTAKETLINFFKSFDMHQMNRVSANQLMAGLTLFCGGSKTSKLTFAFSLFEKESKGKNKKANGDAGSLSGQELFFFLRSILIVLFSCCEQSLELTAGPVGKYIAETANYVTNDIMKYQWKMRKVKFINFDEFGKWYNDGGYKIAPWIELLDLDKWAYLDNNKAKEMIEKAERELESKMIDSKVDSKESETEMKQVMDVPSKLTTPKIEKNEPSLDAMEPNPLSNLNSEQMIIDAHDPLMNLGGFGEIGDMGDFDDLLNFADLPVDEMLPHTQVSSIDPVVPPTTIIHTFKTILSENDSRDCSYDQQRFDTIRQILLSHKINETPFKTLRRAIYGMAKKGQVTQEAFEKALPKAFNSYVTASEHDFLSQLFGYFSWPDINPRGKPKASAAELTCALAVLCNGRKADKLQFAFEILDPKKRGYITYDEMTSFLRSFLSIIVHLSSSRFGSLPTTSFELKKEDKKMYRECINQVCTHATNLICKSDSPDKDNVKIRYDDFADWYTNGGYSIITWIEMLDLEKWILSNP